MSNLLLNVQIAPTDVLPEFSQRERNVFHTTYLEETAFYTLVQQGRVEDVKASFQKYLNCGVVVGKMSDDQLRQAKYWAVCCVTLGLRYAIQGGLDEMTAFNLSDRYILAIDKMNASDQVYAFLADKVLELTEMVNHSSHKNCYSYVKRCLQYIDVNLHKKISVAELAALVNVNGCYLSKVFKKQVGESINAYVIRKKLEAAKNLLKTNVEIKQVAYILGFCSQSYFIEQFKKAFGATPYAFKLQNS